MIQINDPYFLKADGKVPQIMKWSVELTLVIDYLKKWTTSLTLPLSCCFWHPILFYDLETLKWETRRNALVIHIYNLIVKISWFLWSLLRYEKYWFWKSELPPTFTHLPFIFKQIGPFFSETNLLKMTNKILVRWRLRKISTLFKLVTGWHLIRWSFSIKQISEIRTFY